MKNGDKVVTAGGIHGKIREVGDTWFIVEISDGVRIKIEKTSVYASTADARSQLIRSTLSHTINGCKSYLP